MNPVELLLSRLPDAKKSGAGWSVRCPAHEDRRASLSISEGDNGGAIVYCHAGCSAEAVVGAVGLTLKDLMPGDNGNGHHNSGATSDGKKKKPPMLLGWSKQAATRKLSELVGDGAKAVRGWDYGPFSVVRINLPTPAGEKQRKEFRPIHHAPLGNHGAMGYYLGYPPELKSRPLYRLDTINGATDTSTVAVLGGEKCADAAGALGLLATCNAGGEKAIDRTDWRPLSRFSVVAIFTDNDPTGEQFGAAIAAKLKGLKPDLTVKVVRLPGLPPKGDIVEWIDAHGDAAEPDTMREEIEALVAAAAEWTAPPATSAPAASTNTASTTYPPIAPGTWVILPDRGNRGQVTADNGTTCTVHIVNPETGASFDGEFSKSQLRTLDGRPLVPATEPPRFTNVITTRDFLLMDLRQSYLIDRVTVQGQQGTIGGRSKCCKTLVALNMALSVASGTPFLGYFDVPAAAPVGFLSYESGGATLQRTFTRMARARGLTPDATADLPIFWQFEDRICLSDPVHIDAAAELVKQRGLKLLIVDPLYLTLFGPGDVPKSGDLFYMGQRLAPLGELAHSTGAAVYVCHHFRKSAIQDNEEPAGLEELSMSGLGEFVRQWVLLQRRTPYGNDGHHELWARIGGSSGHAGMFGLAIDEGLTDGATWQTNVERVGDVRAEVRQQRQNRKAAEQEKRDGEYRQRLLEALQRFPNGDTGKVIREAAGLNPDNFGRAIAPLLKEGRAEHCEVVKGKRTYEGYRPCKV